MKKYDRVFVCNPSPKFDSDDLSHLANEIVYVCDMPMFDNLFEDQYAKRFEGRVLQRMSSFDPEKDVIAYYGDSMIFALIMMFVSDRWEWFDLARYSSKQSCYVVRRMSFDAFIEHEEPQP
jgi:hypothetical protein